MEVRWTSFGSLFDEGYKRYICKYCHKVICTSRKGLFNRDSRIDEKISSHNQNCYAYQKAILRNPNLKYAVSYIINRYEVNK